MTTFIFMGHKIRTTTARRYVVVHAYNGRAFVDKRTDNIATARRAREHMGGIYDRIAAKYVD